MEGAKWKAGTTDADRSYERKAGRVTDVVEGDEDASECVGRGC